MTDELDEVYGRLHRFGPEFGGDEEGNHGLTNHGPMAAEVMVRRRLDVDLDRWLDSYVRRLDELPAPTRPIGTHWRDAIGDARRLPDWTELFGQEVRSRPWREVLAQWWPRLLPGIVAGSTHGVIRVGHAVRTLVSTPDASPAALDELAHGLGFWAARYRAITGVSDPSGDLDPAPAPAAVPRLPERSGRIADRLNRLEHLDAWPSSVTALRPAATQDEVLERLDALIAAAVAFYSAHGQAAPVLLVHTATAPNAVRHVLPVLPAALWSPSLTAAWAASAAITATYAAADAEVTRPIIDLDVAETLAHAAAHGDEHVIKFADTAADAYERTGDPALLAAAVHAADVIAPPAR